MYAEISRYEFSFSFRTIGIRSLKGTGYPIAGRIAECEAYMPAFNISKMQTARIGTQCPILSTIIIMPHIYTCIYIYMNRSWQQHPTRRQLYGHLPPITKTLQARRTRHAGHCWRSKDEIVSDVLLWTPAYGQSKAGRPARTYIQQLCDGMGCNPEDLPEAMNDRETWRERVRDIRASRTSWWWYISWPTVVESDTKTPL